MFIAQFNFKEKQSMLPKFRPVFRFSASNFQTRYTLKLCFARPLRSAPLTQKASER
jgi:hypothetical protein